MILGRSQLLLQRLEPGSRLARQIGLIQHAGERAALLTTQLLAVSRKQALQPRVLDLNAVLAGIEPLLRRLIGENIELVTDRDPTLGAVKADPGQLEQVILNLAINASDAMPQGGRLTFLTANMALDEAYTRRHLGVQPGSYVMLAVSDTGIGMDSATKARIFEPFFTTKEPDRGTGLGLATVYGIVKQSGAHISVQSEPGRGTTFAIYLPRVDEAVTWSDANQSCPEVPRGHETILLVEDDGALRDFVRDTLELYGYAMLEARDGASALRLAEQHAGPIHLLLADVIMPRMSGAELATHLVARHPETRALFMSGYAGDSISRHGVRDSDVTLLAKPFAAKELAEKVRHVLDLPRPDSATAGGPAEPPA